MVATFDNSARKVPLQHMQKLVQTAAGYSPDPPPLGPNQIQLFSYCKPGLLAGSYSILAEQKITSQSPAYSTERYHVYNRKNSVTLDRTVSPFDPKPPIEPQLFEVVAPQFNIDPKLINSYYPPSGHQDEGRILPHICLSDPHFPWERQADAVIDELWDSDKDANGNTLDRNGYITTDPFKIAKRNAVPWVW
jgi:hypothetical protein